MAFARAVVLTGGPTHDFPATTGCLSTLLHEQDWSRSSTRTWTTACAHSPERRCWW